MDSEIVERLRKLQLADLGSSRRDHISTEDNKAPKSNGRSDAILKAIDASRESNKSGTAAQKLAKQNEAQIEGWTSLHTTIGDTGGLELLDDMLDGQTHRLHMGINTSSQYSDSSKNGKETARKSSGNIAGSKRPAPLPELARSAPGNSRKIRKGPPNTGAQRNSNTVPTKRRRPMEDFSRCISSPEDFLAYARSMRETQTSLPVSKSESNVSRMEPDFQGVEAAKLAPPPLPPAIKKMFSKNSVAVPPPAPKETPQTAPAASPASAPGPSKELPKPAISASHSASKTPIAEAPAAIPSSGAPDIPSPTSAVPTTTENGPSKKIRVSLPKVSPSEPSKTSSALNVAEALALIASAALISSSKPARQRSTATIPAQATSSTTSETLKNLAADTLTLSSPMAPKRASSCEVKHPNKAVCSAPSNVGTTSTSTSELSKNTTVPPFFPSPPAASRRDLADPTSNLSSRSGTPSLTPASGLSASVHASAVVLSSSTSSRGEGANKTASSIQLPPSTPVPAHSTKLLRSINAPPFVPSPPGKSPVSASPSVSNRKLSQSAHAAPFVPTTPSASAKEVANNDVTSTLSKDSITSLPPVTFKLPKAVAETPATVGILLDFDAPQEPRSVPKSPGMEDLMEINFHVAPKVPEKLNTLQAPKAPLGKPSQSLMSPRQALSPGSFTSSSRGPTSNMSGQSRTILGDHNLPGRRHGVVAGDLGDSIYAEVPGLRKRWVLS